MCSRLVSVKNTSVPRRHSSVWAKSAVAAGCTVLCVPHHVPILEGEGRVFAETLSGLDAAGLARLVEAYAAR